jgi:NADH-quinone oxidoreductase subunit L
MSGTISTVQTQISLVGQLATFFATSTIVLPAIALVSFFMVELLSDKLTERRIMRYSIATYILSLLSALLAVVFFSLSPNQFMDMHVVESQMTSVFSVSSYHFQLGVLIDHYSLAYLTLIHLLCLSIASFSSRYLIQEPNAAIFWKLLMLFGMSLSLLTLAHTLDLLFVGWEMVGISSALLIAFYKERFEPVKHSLMAFSVYRVCDIGLLLAIVVLHHSTHSGDLLAYMSNSHADHLRHSATLLGILLLFASMGKSAQYPFLSWLPRAMEGPTPSSAIFYGALSVHAGAYLLIRTAPLWDSSIVVQGLMFMIGLMTTTIGNLSGRTQSDVKSKIAFGVIGQVGLIFIEISLGFYHIAMFHIWGHAVLRTLQLLRAPSTLDDILNVENKLGVVRPQNPWLLQKILTEAQCRAVYRFAVERAWTDYFAFALMNQIKKALRSLQWIEHRMSNIFDHGPEERVRELPEFKGNLIDFGFIDEQDEFEVNADNVKDQVAIVTAQIQKNESQSPTIIQKAKSKIQKKMKSKFGNKRAHKISLSPFSWMKQKMNTHTQKGDQQ